MKSGNAATMKPGETKVKTRAGLVGIFIALMAGNRALVRFGGQDHTEYLSDLEAVTE
jgi:hypothetical protein